MVIHFYACSSEIRHRLTWANLGEDGQLIKHREVKLGPHPSERDTVAKIEVLLPEREGGKGVKC